MYNVNVRPLLQKEGKLKVSGKDITDTAFDILKREAQGLRQQTVKKH